MKIFCIGKQFPKRAIWAALRIGMPFGMKSTVETYTGAVLSKLTGLFLLLKHIACSIAINLRVAQAELSWFLDTLAWDSIRSRFSRWYMAMHDIPVPRYGSVFTHSKWSCYIIFPTATLTTLGKKLDGIKLTPCILQIAGRKQYVMWWLLTGGILKMCCASGYWLKGKWCSSNGTESEMLWIFIH